jgi:predicted acetyltransferase
VKPLLTTIFPPGSPIKWALPELWVTVETPDDGVIAHAGIYRRQGTWKGRRVRLGGIGALGTHPDHRRKGYASVVLNAAIQTLKDEKAIDFVLLVTQPNNFGFYEKRGWAAFNGDLYVEQNAERVRFDAMTPFVYDMRYGPRDGTIDLCGLPW